MLHLKRFIAFLTAFTVVFNTAAQAADWVVDTDADNDPDTCVANDWIDDDNCTLRDALSQLANGDSIFFSDNYTIVNSGASYNVTADSVSFVPNNTVLDGDDTGVDALVIDGEDFSLSAGLYIINGFDAGVVINAGATNATLSGVSVGVESNGSTVTGNTGNGIEVYGDDATIQSNSTISGNGGHGVFVDGTDTFTLNGNYIGLANFGADAAGNAGSGVFIQGDTANGTLINGNSIGANGGSGVEFGTTGTLGGTHMISGGKIGLNTNGNAVRANNAYGVYAAPNATSVLDLVIGTNGDNSNDFGENIEISGNALGGVYLEDCSNLVLAGAKIGAGGASGDIDYGNGGDGVNVDCETVRIGSNADGVSDFNEKVVVSGNDGYGVNFSGDDLTSVEMASVHIGAINSGGADQGGAPLPNEAGAMLVDAASLTSFVFGAVGSFASDFRSIVIKNNGGIEVIGTGDDAVFEFKNILLGHEGGFGQPEAAGNNNGDDDLGNGLHIDLATGNILTLLIGTDGDGSSDAFEALLVADNNVGIYLGNGINAATIAGNFFGLLEDNFLDAGQYNDDAGNASHAVHVNSTDGLMTNFTFGGDAGAEGNFVGFNGGYGLFVEAADGADITVENNAFGFGEDLSTTAANGDVNIGIEGGEAIVIDGNKVVNSADNAVEVFAGTSLEVYGNFIGTNGMDNYDTVGHGLYIASSTLTSVVIGGVTSGLANVIAASGGRGIFIETLAANNTPVEIYGNYVGLCAFPSSGNVGVDLAGCANAGDGLRALMGDYTVGDDSSLDADGEGAELGGANVFSNNGGYGMYFGGTVTGVELVGNIVGLTRSSGGQAFNTGGNGNGLDGVRIDSASLTTATVGTVGGVVADSGMNVFAANGGVGLNFLVTAAGATVTIVNNIFGSDFTGTEDLGNAGDGLNLDADAAVTLGNGATAGRNQASGNAGCGVEANFGTLVNSLNLIGLLADGVTVEANDLGDLCDNLPQESSGRRISFTSSSVAETVTEEEDVATEEEDAVEEEAVEQAPTVEDVVDFVEDMFNGFADVVDLAEAVKQFEIDELELNAAREAAEDKGFAPDFVAVDNGFAPDFEGADNGFAPDFEEVEDRGFAPDFVAIDNGFAPDFVAVDNGFAPDFEGVEAELLAFGQVEGPRVEALPIFEYPRFAGLEEEDVKRGVQEKMDRVVFAGEVPGVDGEPVRMNAATKFVFEPKYGRALTLQKRARDRGENVVVVTPFSDLDEDGVADTIEALIDDKVDLKKDDGRELSRRIFRGETQVWGEAMNCVLPTEGFRITNVPKYCGKVGSKISAWVAGLEPGEKYSMMVVEKDGDNYRIVKNMGEKEMDENGHSVVEVDFEDEGDYYLVARSSEDRQFYVVRVEVDEDLDGVVKNLNFEENDVNFDVEKGLVRGFANPGEMVFITWESVVFNSVYIADSDQGYFEARVPAGLPAGAEHKLTVYSYNPNEAWLSSVAGVLFNN